MLNYLEVKWPGGKTYRTIVVQLTEKRCH